MTGLTLPNGGGVVSFKYDPFGRRIQKSSPNGTTNYIYSSRDLVEELDQNGNGLARYTQGLDMDEPLAQIRTGATSYYEQDGLTSVTSMTDTAAAITQTYTYRTFGGIIASSGTLTNPLQYTAREFDPETGLHNYRARYLDTSTGRFMKEDPIVFSGGINFYTYVANDPIDYRDPSGKKTFRVHGNWCGPDWTGGLREQYTPAHDKVYKSPIDYVDQVCMHHDKCYYWCRKNNQCDADARSACMHLCDGILGVQLNTYEGLFSSWGWGWPVSMGVDLGHTFSVDPGPNGDPDIH